MLNGANCSRSNDLGRFRLYLGRKLYGRKQNVIEYKRPGEKINRRILRKTAGYGYFYIGLAKHEGDVLEKDVESLISASEGEKDAETKDRYARILNLIGVKNPVLYEDLIRRHGEMGDCDYLMELLRPRIEKEQAEKTRTNLYIYVQDGQMGVDYAARKANMSTTEFADSMRNAGYKVPEEALV